MLKFYFYDSYDLFPENINILINFYVLLNDGDNLIKNMMKFRNLLRLLISKNIHKSVFVWQINRRVAESNNSANRTRTKRSDPPKGIERFSFEPFISYNKYCIFAERSVHLLIRRPPIRKYIYFHLLRRRSAIKSLFSKLTLYV